MDLPTWLYSAEGSKLFTDQASYDQAIKDGWKDSPRYFNGTEPLPETAKADDDSEPESSPFASKTAEKFATENGIDPATVKGTGANGKITIGDLKALPPKEVAPPADTDKAA